jgi:hypothetical protein
MIAGKKGSKPRAIARSFEVPEARAGWENRLIWSRAAAYIMDQRVSYHTMTLEKLLPIGTKGAQ